MNNKFSINIIGKISLLVFAVVSLSSCKPPFSPKEKDDSVIATKPTRIFQKNIDENHAAELTDSFWQQGMTSLKEAQIIAKGLEEKINLLLTDPNKTTLQESYSQWEKLFIAYQKLAPLTFIEHASLSDTLGEWRFSLAAWPLHPGYLDSYDVYIQSGIVNDITLPITTATLRKQHGLTDSEEVTLGIYAIEFLLKGDASKQPANRFTQQTKVPLKLAQVGLKVKELPNNRRRQLIQFQSQLLSNDFDLFTQQWQVGGLLSTIFLQLPPLDKIRAYHRGQIFALEKLDALLSYKIESETSKEDASPKNNYLKRFSSNRKLAVAEQIAVIESLYFSNNSEGTDKKIAFIDMLSESEQEKIKEKIEGIKKQLTK